MERHARGLPLQNFTGIGIHPILDCAHLPLRIIGDVGTLGYEPPDDAVVVLVRPPLETAVGMGEVEHQPLLQGAHRLLQTRDVGKLSPIVPGDRPEQQPEERRTNLPLDHIKLLLDRPGSAAVDPAGDFETGG